MAKRNNGNWNKGKKQNRGRRSRGKEVEVNIPKGSVNMADIPHVLYSGIDKNGANDPSWYTQIPELANDAAQLSFGQPIGNKVKPFERNTVQFQGTSTSGVNGTLGQRINASESVPGIMTFDLLPTIGIAEGPNSPINIAAQQIYTLIRKANSGAINYDKTEVIMLMVAMNNAYMLYEELVRGYKCFTENNPENRYIPNGLAYSLGYNPSLIMQLADMRAAIDQFVYQMGSVNIPDQFTYFKRSAWLYSHVYTDADSRKAQLYAYKPYGYYIWTEGEDSSPTYLKFITRQELFTGKPPASTDQTQNYLVRSVDEIWTAINTIMRPILGSEDVGTIAGDMAKAFGEGGMIHLRTVDSYESLTPMYNPEVIEQMANSTIFQYPQLADGVDPTTRAGINITQSLSNTSAGPYLLHKPVFKLVQGPAYFDFLAKSFRKHLLNYRMLTPSVDNNLTSTRLVSHIDSNYNYDRGNSQILALDSCGTEVVMGAQMHILIDQQGATADPMIPNAFPFAQDSALQMDMESSAATQYLSKGLPALLALTAASAAFDNSPTQYFWMYTKESSSSGIEYTMNYCGAKADMNIYKYLAEEEIWNLNNAAIMSEFKVKDFPITMR